MATQSSAASAHVRGKVLAFRDNLMDRLRQRGGHDMRSTVWSLGDQLMVSGANFAIGIAVARGLGVSEFGQFTLALVLAAFATVLVDYVMCAPMMTLAGRRQRRTGNYYLSVLAIATGMAVLAGVMIAAVLAAVWAGRDGTASLWLIAAAALATFAQTVHAVVRRTLFARAQFLTAFVTDAVRYTGFVALGALLWLTVDAPDAGHVLVLLAVSAVMAVVVPAVALARHRVRARLVSAIWSRHWPAARWMVAMAVVALGQEQLVWIIVAIGLGDAAVGGLRAAAHLLGLTHFIAMAKENFVPRAASAAYDTGGVDALLAYLWRQTLVLGIPTFGLIALICLPAHMWLELLYGEEFATYAPALWLFGASYAVVFLRELWVYYLRTIERTRAMFTSFALSSATALVLIWPALMWFDVLGAALVVLLAHLVSTAFIAVEIWRHVHAHRLETMGRDRFTVSMPPAAASQS